MLLIRDLAWTETNLRLPPADRKDDRFNWVQPALSAGLTIARLGDECPGGPYTKDPYTLYSGSVWAFTGSLAECQEVWQLLLEAAASGKSGFLRIEREDDHLVARLYRKQDHQGPDYSTAAFRLNEEDHIAAFLERRRRQSEPHQVSEGGKT